MAIIERVKNICLKPKVEWPIIAAEPTTAGGLIAGYVALVQASTTMTKLLEPVIVNPKRFVRTPKLDPLVCTCGFHSTVGRPPNVAPQPAVPSR